MIRRARGSRAAALKQLIEIHVLADQLDRAPHLPSRFGIDFYFYSRNQHHGVIGLQARSDYGDVVLIQIRIVEVILLQEHAPATVAGDNDAAEWTFVDGHFQKLVLDLVNGLIESGVAYDEEHVSKLVELINFNETAGQGLLHPIGHTIGIVQYAALNGRPHR